MRATRLDMPGPTPPDQEQRPAWAQSLRHTLPGALSDHPAGQDRTLLATAVPNKAATCIALAFDGYEVSKDPQGLTSPDFFMISSG